MGGQVFVVWVRRVSDNDTDIFFRRRDSSGEWQIEVPVANDAGVVEDQPTIAVSAADNTLHVLYRRKTSGQGATTEIYHRYSISNNFGASWSSARPVSSLTDVHPIGGGLRKALHPSVAVDGNGIIWGTWHNVARATGNNDEGTLFYSFLKPSDFSGGAWLEQKPLSTSSYDSWAFDSDRTLPTVCNSSDCWWRRSFATGPEQNGIIINGSDLFFVFKDDPYRQPDNGLLKFDVNGAVVDSLPRDVSCSDAADDIFYKKGVWSESLGRIAWWEETTLLEGSDIRAGYRPAEDPTLLLQTLCPAPPWVTGPVPPSYLPLPGSQRHKLIFQPGPTIARTSNGTIYTIWEDQTPLGFESNSSLVGDDVWCREWKRDQGIDGIDKQADLHCVSRSALDSPPGIRETYREPKAAADQLDWVHVVYSVAKVSGISGSPDPEDPTAVCDQARVDELWNDASRQIHYSTHFQNDPADDWGWEIPISEGPKGSFYSSIATDGNQGVHVLWTQHDVSGDGTLDVIYREGQPLPDSVPVGQTMTWTGDVFLDADFVVPATSVLVIEPGTKIWAQAEYDRFDQGNDPTRVEIIVRGQLDAVGTVGLPILFESTKASAVGEWGGIVFDVPGCECNGYGFSASLGEMSRIENASIQHATNGILIQNFQAPSLVNVTFANITGNRHIFVDHTDIFIPYAKFTDGWCDDVYTAGGGIWDLLGGTHVVVAKSTLPGKDLTCIGETGKVDILVDGVLLTDESSPGLEDYVYFEPEATTPPGPTAWQDWGGIFLSFYSGGSLLRYADIGYAANPIYLYYPGSQQILNSRIHHFADLGVWAYGTLGTEGPTFDQILVERGDANPDTKTLGSAGMFIDQADGTDLLNSRIDLTGYRPGTGLFSSVGLGLNCQSVCAAPSGNARTLTVEKNVIQGPGTSFNFGTLNDVGIDAVVLCGSASPVRDALFLENRVQGWKKLGLNLVEPFDISVTCNLFTDVFSGIDIVRGSTQTGGPLTFRENRVDIKINDVTRFAVKENDVQATLLGPDVAGTSGTGKNELGVRDTNRNTKFIREEDPDSAHLNAINNYWFKFNLAGTRNQLTVADSISSRFSPAGTTEIDFETFFTTPPSSSCQVPSETIRLPQAMEDPELARASDVPGLAVPGEIQLGLPRPNPSTSGIAIELQLPAGVLGPLTLEIFDVTGRRVYSNRSSVSGPATVDLDWPRTDSRGKRVESGIYFMRISGPQSFTATRKVVVAR